MKSSTRTELNPRLRSMPWWDPDEIPATALLEQNYEAIRVEFLNVLVCGLLRLHPQSKDGPGKQIANGNWNIFELFSRGQANTQNVTLAPRTIGVLRRLPEITTHPCGFAYFSVLGPRVRIAPHRGPVSSRIRVHLGLRVPLGAIMRVGQESRSWEEGMCSVFDDSWEHEVVNPSDSYRAVLLVDVWHPDLTLRQRSRLVSRVSARERYNEKLEKGRRGWLSIPGTSAAVPSLVSLVGTRQLREMIASAAKTSASSDQILETLRDFACGSEGDAGAAGLGPLAARSADCHHLWPALASLAARRPTGLSADDVVNIIHICCAWWRSSPSNERSLWRWMRRVDPRAPLLTVPPTVRGTSDVLTWCAMQGEAAPFAVIAASAVVAIRKAGQPRGRF